MLIGRAANLKSQISDLNSQIRNLPRHDSNVDRLSQSQVCYRLHHRAIWDFKSQISNFKSQISNLKSQISAFRFQISNLRFQISDFKAAPLRFERRFPDPESGVLPVAPQGKSKSQI